MYRTGQTAWMHRPASFIVKYLKLVYFSVYIIIRSNSENSIGLKDEHVNL